MSNESVTVRDSSSSATTVASNTASVADNSTSEDQYADGKAAALWNLYVGSTQARTTVYRENICRLLRSHGCYHVLDVACGTGIDSIMLLEEGFQVTSIDFSDKMLKHAQKMRWNRRKEDAFDKWVIEEGNWLTLMDTDIEFPEDGFDAVVCLGNSFAHLPDSDGSQAQHRRALRNFADAVKPGGILLIDHRNYDAIIDTGRAPSGNIYYNSAYIKNLITSVVRVDGVPSSITLDYNLEVPARLLINGKAARSKLVTMPPDDQQEEEPKVSSHFQLSYFPHRLQSFGSLIDEAFGDWLESREILGDFKELTDDFTPGYFIHIVKRKPSIEPSSKRQLM